MASVKITDLTAYTNPVATDVLPIVDVGADVTKKVSIQDLLKNAGDGTAAAPGIAFDGDSDTGIYRPGADQLALSTNGTGRLFIDSSGNVGIGTTTVDNKLQVVGDVGIGDIGTSGTYDLYWAPNTAGQSVKWFRNDNGSLQFGGGATAGTGTQLVIDSAGRILVGTSSARAGSNFKDGGYTVLTQAEGGADNQSYGGSFVANSGTTNNTGRGCILTLGRTRGTSVNSNTSVANNDLISRIQFSGADGTNLVPAAWIQGFVDGTPSTDDMPGRLVFSVTGSGNSSPTEAMRIKNSRILNFANTPVYADNAAAKTGGLVDGDVYRKSDGTLMIVYT